LSDTLKGKQGRFRQNLLGKRVDYRTLVHRGRTRTQAHQCGLRRRWRSTVQAFIYHRLEQTALHNHQAGEGNGGAAGALVGHLEEVIKDHDVLLNRAPTLHRLAFRRSSRCWWKASDQDPFRGRTAFNADFDGDQMAVHIRSR